MEIVFEIVALVVTAATPLVFFAVWTAALAIGTPAPIKTAVQRTAALAGHLGIVLILLGFVASGLWDRVREREWTWVVLLSVMWGGVVLALWGSTRFAVRRRMAAGAAPSRRHYWLTGLQGPRPDPHCPHNPPATHD